MRCRSVVVHFQSKVNWIETEIGKIKLPIRNFGDYQRHPCNTGRVKGMIAVWLCCVRSFRCRFESGRSWVRRLLAGWNEEITNLMASSTGAAARTWEL
ncbi:hypothetical protein MKW98_012364 [Papaver atlanticum]|uniref:Uncharacterized protein n=1 Tax=Papaver atlanticum TaxID=357466 RepID=A0AAD4T1V5_9MAGN|nr:hypothetical protein MKW98_012364 [Papaver atlanticum]